MIKQKLRTRRQETIKPMHTRVTNDSIIFGSQSRVESQPSISSSQYTSTQGEHRSELTASPASANLGRQFSKVKTSMEYKPSRQLLSCLPHSCSSSKQGDFEGLWIVVKIGKDEECHVRIEKSDGVFLLSKKKSNHAIAEI